MAVKLIHKNSGVKNKPAAVSQLDYGEIAINWHESGPFLQVKDSQNEIVRVGGVIIQDNQPALAQKGAFWVSGNQLYLYNGTAWILIAGGGGGGGSDFTACTNGGLEYDGGADCWRIDEAWLLQWAQNNINTEEPGDGKLTIVDADGDPLGEFTANQDGDTVITIPVGPVDWNEIENKPTIGDGAIVINGGDGINASGDNATANQATDTARTLSVDTNWLGTWIDTNRPAPNVGDGEITIKDSDGNPVGTFNVNQASDQDILLPEVVIPESLHPKGFINVEDPAPDNPEHGDIYIQHKDDFQDGISDASFAPGIPTGTAVEEGTFVMYGADLQWHAGGNSNSTQVQSDWNETNTTEPSFIQNKPDLTVYMPLDIRTLEELS